MIAHLLLNILIMVLFCYFGWNSFKNLKARYPSTAGRGADKVINLAKRFPIDFVIIAIAILIVWVNGATIIAMI